MDDITNSLLILLLLFIPTVIILFIIYVMVNETDSSLKNILLCK